MQYRFPLSFVVLTTIVFALRVWIEHETPRQRVVGDVPVEGEDTPVTGKIGGRRTHKLEASAGSEAISLSARNEEIASQVRRESELKLAVFPERLPTLNARDQFPDRSVVPYHFQPVSHSLIESRSASLDGKLWADDDATRDESEEAVVHTIPE